jgi:diguanylate cyclase (GGDEF)-like protein
LDLDGHTLLVTGFSARVAFALIFLVTWLRSPGERYLLDWGISTGLVALGFLTVLASGPAENYLDAAHGFLAYTLVGAGFTIGWIGVRRFDGRRVPKPLAAVSALAPGSAYVATLVLTGEPNFAFSVMFAGMSVSCATLAFDLLVARARRSLPSRYVAGVAFTCYPAGFVVAATLSLFETAGTTGGIGSDVLVLAVDQFASIVGNVALIALAGERARADLEELATRDPLTGLDNRRGLLLDASRLLPDDGPTPAIAVLVCDIDRFKHINDGHGHPVGDRVLVRFAELALGELRRDVDLLARWGGEEFVAVLPGAALEEALAVAERLRSAVEAEPFLVPPLRLHLTVSIGVATLASGERTLGPAIARADAALYAAKQAGRNRIAT